MAVRLWQGRWSVVGAAGANHIYSAINLLVGVVLPVGAKPPFAAAPRGANATIAPSAGWRPTDKTGIHRRDGYLFSVVLY